MSFSSSILHSETIHTYTSMQIYRTIFNQYQRLL